MCLRQRCAVLLVISSVGANSAFTLTRAEAKDWGRTHSLVVRGLQVPLMFNQSFDPGFFIALHNKDLGIAREIHTNHRTGVAPEE